MTLIPHISRLALAAGLALTLSACGGVSTNRMITPQHQAVVTHAAFTLDLIAGPDGISPAEQTRLAGWFDAMGLRYGDQVAIDDPLASEATRASVSALVAKHGLLVAPRPPLTQASLNAGTVRITLTRASATVPGCPDWSSNSETNLNNATHPNFGCATNGNLAMMVANPDDLLRGATSNSNTVITSNKAVSTLREAKPSGAGGLAATSSKGS
jgi:pilus assembly protein CpaD